MRLSIMGLVKLWTPPADGEAARRTVALLNAPSGVVTIVEDD